MLETLIGVGGSLLGGLLGASGARGAAKSAAYMEDTRLARLRLRAEESGFNPLTVLQNGGLNSSYTPPTPQNYMGQAIADSALMLADSLAKTKAAASGRQVQDLQRQRDILTRKLTQQTIRPTVPGVFQRAQAFGTGSANGQAAAAGLSGNSPAVPAGPPDRTRIATTTAIDPRREVEALPVPNDPGFALVDNPYVGDPIPVPMVNGELVGIQHLPVMGMSWGADRAFRWWQRTQPSAAYGQKPGIAIPESQMRKPFPRKGSENAFNYHMGRHRPYPAWARPQ